MAKRVVAVNASPRKGWNTDMLVSEAARGAEETGATVEKFDLYRLDKYTGCISCFGCKRERSAGRCVCRDGLTPVLDAIREADGLIMGTPNYLGEASAGFRALYERLVFQSLTYNLERPCCNQREVPTLLIMTSNAPDAYYADLMKGYQQTLSRFVGPAQVLRSGNTLQVKDYEKLDWEWTMFDPAEKRRRREEVFPQELARAFELGSTLFVH
ncbi:MAG: flavodoxin family protein [Atopobiaceae bacterium]|nr:flavodoxin family protein [Atopobiaceae bacterium]